MATISGIDISHWQGTELSSFQNDQNGLTFIFCKATEGTDIIDPRFEDNWPLVAEKGFTRGAYHFFHCKQDIDKQVTNFINVVKAFPKTDLPPAVDFEYSSIAALSSLDGYTGTNAEENKLILNSLIAFLTALQEQTGRTPILYTGSSLCNNLLSDPVLKNYPLYVAEYTDAAEPRISGSVWGENGWSFWQKSCYYTIDKVTNDLDVYNDTLMSFPEFLSKY